MSDIKVPGNEFVGEETGFRVVGPAESVIFVSYSPDGGMVFYDSEFCSPAQFLYFSELNIELAVIRDAGIHNDPDFGAAFYDWLRAVVDDACDARRNVRVSCFPLIWYRSPLIFY